MNLRSHTSREKLRIRCLAIRGAFGRRGVPFQSAAIAAIALIALCPGAAQGQNAVTLLKKLDEGFSAVFEKVAPSVVVIEATKDDAEEEGGTDRPPDFFQKDDDERRAPKERGWRIPDSPALSEGSGFIIRPNGFILTNLHVIEGATKLEVRTYAGKRLEAKIVGSDSKTDIAVIKVEAEKLPAANFGDSDALRIGQLVCAIGAPFSQDYSFTCGWVSGKGRTDLLARSTNKLLYEDYIQTDAFINPGNSGGPLFDVEGRVVGMNTLINGLGRGLAFAIPSNLLRSAADQIIETGKVSRPWLGVRVTSLSDSKSMREQFPGIEDGVVVSTIEAGAPAFKSDLQPGDLVTAVDGTALKTAHDLVRRVQMKKVGDTLQLTVSRRGQTLTIPVATGEQPAEISRLTIPRPVPLPEVAPEEFGLKLTDADGAGAKVMEVTPGSPASRTELKAADIVTDVNAEPTPTAAAAREAIKNALSKEPRKGVLLNYLRDGKKSWVVIERANR